MGTPEEALKFGGLGGDWVGVGPSGVCKFLEKTRKMGYGIDGDGDEDKDEHEEKGSLNRKKEKENLGVFAKRSFKKGQYITSYTSYIRRANKVSKKNVYCLEHHDGRLEVGVASLKRLQGRGIAQLANDALCHLVTGLRNNCEFRENGKRTFLYTTRDVECGEEILVHYGWSYWSGDNLSFLSSSQKREISGHVNLAKCMSEKYNLDLATCNHENNGEIHFNLFKKWRMCPGAFIHHDKNFYITKRNNMFFYCCNVCNTRGSLL
jgi:hypothetical protein